MRSDGTNMMITQESGWVSHQVHQNSTSANINPPGHSMVSKLLTSSGKISHVDLRHAHAERRGRHRDVQVRRRTEAIVTSGKRSTLDDSLFAAADLLLLQQMVREPNKSPW
ncbi:MAG: hypothetical protein IPI67_17845 [Myxococcales bacterium]|nr:hypothetical protein [Myxococcales bacterium]